MESVGGPEQGSLRCRADGTNKSLVIVCTQATATQATATQATATQANISLCRLFESEVYSSGGA